MDPLTPADVIATLRSKVLRTRVGLWLMPPELWRKETAEAVRLGVESVDLRARLLDELAEDASFVNLDEKRLFTLLDKVANASGNSCALIHHLDLLLAAFPPDRCRAWWSQLSDGLPYARRGLLLAMPQTADHLLPSHTLLAQWRRDRRVAGLLPFSQETHNADDVYSW